MSATWVDRSEPAEPSGSVLRSCRMYVPGVRHCIHFGIYGLSRELDAPTYVERYWRHTGSIAWNKEVRVIVERRTWHPYLQAFIVVTTDESGAGRGTAVWLNGMRVRCVESDEYAGFWRYEIGLFALVIFRLAETGAFTSTVTYALDRLPLAQEIVFHAAHDEALTEALERIQRDGRGVGNDAVADFTKIRRFPCPNNVLPDAVRIVRSNGSPARRLHNAEPFDTTVTRPEDVRRLYDAIGEMEPVEGDVISTGSDFSVDYRLMFYQNDAQVLQVQVLTRGAQFLYDLTLGREQGYWTGDRFWPLLAATLQWVVDDLFPNPE